MHVRHIEARLHELWEVKLITYLWGVSASDWIAMVRDNEFRIAPRYWTRTAMISALSVANSIWRYVENARFAERIEAAQICTSPIFVLGHWGSGTTLLHTLLAQDPHMAYPNLYQVANPHSFLTSERIVRKLFGHLTPRKRVFDNVSVSLDMPAEDEFAMSLLCPYSPYLSWSFPSREAHYDRYLTFADVACAELSEWRQQLVRFFKKLTIKYGRPLLLKSPPHTARVQILLDLFPDAKFVHICRNPYSIFQSTRQLYLKALPYFYLQRAKPDEMELGILRRFQQMHQAFFKQRDLVPDGQICYISYEQLEQDPVSSIRHVYRSLRLDGFPQFADYLKRYVASLAGYKKNSFSPLQPRERELIASYCYTAFDAWGYER